MVADTLPVQMDLMKEGLSLGQVGQRPFEMGYKTMYFLLDIKKDGKNPEDPTYTASTCARPTPPIPASAAEQRLIGRTAPGLPGAVLRNRDEHGRSATVRLRRGGVELDLCPHVGGAITGLRWRGRDAAAGGSGVPERRRSVVRELVSAGAVLQPHRGCALRVPGPVYQLARNLPPEPHAIHGHGWQRPWTVEQASARRAELTFKNAVAGTPLDYRARQTFALHEDGLEIALELTNAGAGPMPAGIGQHPYFVRTDGVTLRARLDHVWLPDERKIPRSGFRRPRRGTLPTGNA